MSTSSPPASAAACAAAGARRSIRIRASSKRSSSVTRWRVWAVRSEESSCRPRCDDDNRAVRPRPDRLERLPPQYFAALLRRVAEAGADVVDLGRGNPEVGPPSHVVEALQRAAARPDVHGYAPFRGLPSLRAAITSRYREIYGVELDPDREVAVLPGTKTAIVELAVCLAQRGDRILLTDPCYPDYYSGVALAGAELGLVPLDPANGFAPDLDNAPDAV